MRINGTQWSACLLASAIALAAGCHGPISLLPPDGQGSPLAHDYSQCGGPVGGATADGSLQVAAPHSNFHPVPTRPVFTPWAPSDSQEPGSQLAWMRATSHEPADDNMPLDKVADGRRDPATARQPKPLAPLTPPTDDHPPNPWHAPSWRF